MSDFSLYIHIPFCKNAKCLYCDFVSFCGEENRIDDYLSALNLEMQRRAGDFATKTLQTIFIGGGTPSILSISQITRLFDMIKSHFSLKNCSEITIECNPESISEEKLKTYKTLGINRLSIGAQSMNDCVLKTVGRQHDTQTFKTALNLAQKYFSNINVDMMLGLPHQTLKDAVEMANFLAQSGILHISAYVLMLEDSTRLYSDVQSGKITLPSDTKTLEMLDCVSKILQENGFLRYEISNFAKKGFASEHNLNYWHRGEYLGLGVSAHSFVGGTRQANTPSLDDYIKALNSGNLPTIFEEKLTPKEIEEEFVMLSLRLREGIDIDKYNEQFNKNLLKEKSSQIKLLLSQNLIKLTPTHLSLTPLGTHLLNQITLALL